MVPRKCKNSESDPTSLAQTVSRKGKHVDADYNKKYYQKNRQKISQRAKQWRKDNPERYREQWTSYCQKNREKVRLYRKRYYRKNKKRMNFRSMQNYWKDQKGIVLRRKGLRERRRIEVFNGLGAKCDCCGELERKFLTVDHVRNDGKKHRLVADPDRVWRDIIASGFDRSKYRLLCYNCNCAIYRNSGVCPHKVLGRVKLLA